MSKKCISSAGLVYFHICGTVSEEGEVCLQTCDSYRYFENGFYEQAKENVLETEFDEDVFHVMGVIGVQEKVDAIENVVRDGIRGNMQRICERKNLKKRDSVFDSYGNAFYQLVQEFFCEEPIHFPCGSAVEGPEWKLYYVFDGNPDHENMGRVADSLVTIWIEKEAPIIMGKQLMIRSFFMRDLLDRKVVACIPSKESDTWNILFEGGTSIPIDLEMSYSKDTVSYNELGFFSMSELSQIIMEPAYSFGKIYYPRELCNEWQKVFLFLCAIQKTEWTLNTFGPIYKQFLHFLESNICLTENAPSFISKEDGLQVLLIEIESIRKFL